MRFITNRYSVVLAVSVAALLLTKTFMREGLAGGPGNVQGLDVSSYQGDIDWQSVASGGKVFAYARATEGNTFIDDRFKTNWAAIKSAGIKRGAYHFYRTNDEAKTQAANFLAQFTMAEGDLVPMLDVENGSIPDGDKPDALTVQQGVKEWIDIVEEALGCQPILYTSVDFANTYFTDESFAQYQLWIAEYGVDQPNTTTIWGDNWTAWQYSENGQVSGIDGYVDLDEFNGSEYELMQRLVCKG